MKIKSAFIALTFLAAGEALTVEKVKGVVEDALEENSMAVDAAVELTKVLAGKQDGDNMELSKLISDALSSESEGNNAIKKMMASAIKNNGIYDAQIESVKKRHEELLKGTAKADPDNKKKTEEEEKQKRKLAEEERKRREEEAKLRREEEDRKRNSEGSGGGGGSGSGGSGGSGGGSSGGGSKTSTPKEDKPKVDLATTPKEDIAKMDAPTIRAAVSHNPNACADEATLKNISVQGMSGITKACLEKAQSLSVFTPEQRQKIPVEAIAGVPPEKIADVLPELTAEQFGGLTDQQLKAAPPTTMANLNSPEKVGKVPAAALVNLSLNQVKNIPAPALAGLSASQAVQVGANSPDKDAITKYLSDQNSLSSDARNALVNRTKSGSGSSNMFIIGGVSIVLLAIAGGAAFYFMKMKKD